MSEGDQKTDAMTKKRGQTPGQLSLFEFISYNIDLDVKESMRRSIDESGLSRDQVVDGMNLLAAKYGVRLGNGKGWKLSLDTLEKWLNPNEPERNVSVRALCVFCGVMNDPRPLEVLARPVGARVIGKEEVAELKYGRAIREEKKARRMRRELEKELG